MACAIRLFVLALCATIGLSGCGPSKEDATPNPDLKVPEIPPGGHGSKDLKDPGKKKGR